MSFQASGRSLVFAAAAACALSSGSSFANGYGESRPWQFRTTSDRVNNAVVLELIERNRNGGLQQDYNITNNNTTNVAGNQINCDVSANATGNASSGSLQASTGNAIIDASMANNATATGNQADNAVNHSSGGGSNAFGIQDDDSNDTHNAQDLLNNNQANSGNQNSSASYNSTSANGASASGGGTSNQVLNNNQDASGSTQTATVNDSQACAFNQTNGGDGTGGGGAY